MPFVAIEQLPYLTGVIEGMLRISAGAYGRLQRIWSNEAIQFHEWSITLWALVSTTSMDTQHDPRLFHDPERFVQNPYLDTHIMSSGKEFYAMHRIDLAYAELYLALAAIILRFGSTEMGQEGDRGNLCRTKQMRVMWLLLGISSCRCGGRI